MERVSNGRGTDAPIKPEKTEVTLGIMALTDCAVLAVAKEKGFFAQQGLDVRLSKEASWASVRDKVAVGELDGAQMLAPMPIAATLGIGPLKVPMITAFSLGLNGNAITITESLARRMSEADPNAMDSPISAASALKQVIAGLERKLVFAHVYPYSGHNYELRYWLAAAGIDPDEDVRLVVIPPAQMVNHLKEGTIDGYCVGEPWNGQAISSDIGRTLVTSYELWNNKPEKVFGVTQAWHDKYPGTHQAILVAMLKAAEWADRMDNRWELAEILCGKDYVDAPLGVVSASLLGNLRALCRRPAEPLFDFNVFFRYAASYPWRSHAAWFISQMYRWGQLDEAVDIVRAARDVYRPDLYCRAAEFAGVHCPHIDTKTEGSHETNWVLDGIEMGRDLFFDGSLFDPTKVVDYIRGFEVNRLCVDLNDLTRINKASDAQ
ncbi:MAG: nitrate ABC transporter substrate-binding protein [Gammaproteobacteria bacterium]|nr:nitrate ABC transporter substrate-binding protein [Gammaproteobacteria bacterium]